jgi:outer membrane protein assembly factor BamB
MSRLALILAALVAGSVSAEDWPRWRGPRGDGTWNAPQLPERWPANGLTRVWRQTIGGGYAGIAVADGRVYTLDRKPAELKDADGYERVLCFDAAAGKPLWTHRYPARYGKLGGYSNGPRAMPTVHDGRVYTVGAVGHVHCLDARTGDVIWSRDTVRECKARVPEWGFAAAPVLDGDRVLVHVGAEPNGSLLALDRHTGKEFWRSLPDPAGYCTPILLTSRAGRQVVIWTPENVHGLDPTTGKRLWSIPYQVTYGVAIATPIFREDLVVVTGYWEGAKAIRLGDTPTDARVVWEEPRQLRGLMAQPLYRGGLVYSLDHKDGLVCFELQTGKRLWADHRLTKRGRNPHASFVWTDDAGRALLLNAEGELILARLDRTGYHEQSRARLVEGQVWSHPAYAGSRVYARSDGAERPTAEGPYELVCVELASSKVPGR